MINASFQTTNVEPIQRIVQGARSTTHDVSVEDDRLGSVEWTNQCAIGFGRCWRYSWKTDRVNAYLSATSNHFSSRPFWSQQSRITIPQRHFDQFQFIEPFNPVFCQPLMSRPTDCSVLNHAREPGTPSKRLDLSKMECTTLDSLPT